MFWKILTKLIPLVFQSICYLLISALNSFHNSLPAFSRFFSLLLTEDTDWLRLPHPTCFSEQISQLLIEQYKEESHLWLQHNS